MHCSEGENKMKQFLYLDTDIVNSIIAQSEKGLIQEQSEENGSDKKKDTHISGSMEGSGTAGGSFLKLAKAEANLSLSGELGKEYVSSTTSREIISKVLHDAAFDIAYGYIKPQKLSVGKNDSGEYGDYVELTRVFDFVDMDYLEKLFSKNGLIDFLKKNDKEKIETEASRATGGMNRAQLRSTEKTIKSELKKLIAESDKQYDDIHDTIVAFRQLMPYARMMISYDGYLIPMDDQYFRIDPQNLGFKYGGEITCVGMITNIIGADTNPNDPKNMFATLQFTVNEALRKILPTNKENLCVIHPIAVFYGK
jgi:hypothetical protein